MIEDVSKAFSSPVRKEEILLATVIRKVITIASLEKGIIQQQEILKVEHQGELSKLSRSSITL
jgi:hypothetical protein